MKNSERQAMQKSMTVTLRGYDETTQVACDECGLAYMEHEDELYTIEQPTALSKTPSLTGRGIFGLGTRHAQSKANGRPLA